MSDESPNTVTVTILDKDYQVSCPDDEVQALKKSAEYLDQQMREIRTNATVFGLDRIAVMAALNITNDLLRQSKLAGRLKTGSELQLESLSTKLDRAIGRLKVGN
jgi:cell division protein ZapA